MEYLHKDITDKIIKAFYNVYYKDKRVGEYYADIVVEKK